jgi:hypothetical protein
VEYQQYSTIYFDVGMLSVMASSLQFLRKANIRKGEKVLVNRAGGSFGTFSL